MDWPLIYCNGSSFSSEFYGTKNKAGIYVNYLAKQLNGFALNKSRVGANNRSIIRTSVHDLLHQRRLNPDQKIIAIIGLTYEIWSELWIEDKVPEAEEISNFENHNFTVLQNWKQSLLNNIDILHFGSNKKTENKDKVYEKFYTKYSEGRAYFYSAYAERINLSCDLLMFTGLCKKFDIDYLIFQGPKAEKLEEEYLLDFFNKELYNDNRIFNLEDFGFIDWCIENNFQDIDESKPMGHFGPDAHEAFAHKVLLPKLEETGQI